MEPKNLLFILSDQHTRELTGCYGHDLIQTPYIDRLAEQGTRFDNAYTPCPLCVPARASLATGRYVHDLRLWDNAHPYDGRPTGWGHRLMEAGSHVASIGKLHYRGQEHPTGWNEEIDTLHVAEGSGDLVGSVRTQMQERSSSHKLADDAGCGDSTYTRYDVRNAEHAARWLNEEAPKHRDRPWVLFVGFVLPHFPLRAPPEFFDLYPEVPFPRMYDEAERPDHPVIKEMMRISANDKYFDEEKINTARRAYFGMVTLMDQCIGRILSALNDADLADDTRIIYTSDHGENLGNRGLWGKSNMYEEAVAVPLVMAGPDIPGGQALSTPVNLVDCYQTIVENAGLSLTDEEKELPGHSLLAIARGEEPERILLSEYHASSSSTGFFMIREGRWKYVHYVGQPPQLFDTEADPHETNDLGSSPEHAKVIEACEAKLRSVVDPEAVNQMAFADQAALVERHGGREAVLARGDFSYTPAPGESLLLERSRPPTRSD